jgi:hypothetical protein
LPSIEEWEAMVEYAHAVLGCDPAITSDAGNECWDLECVEAGACSFHNVPFDVLRAWYWSSSTDVRTPNAAWMQDLVSGSLGAADKGQHTNLVWPVRGGQ